MRPEPWVFVAVLDTTRKLSDIWNCRSKVGVELDRIFAWMRPLALPTLTCEPDSLPDATCSISAPHCVLARMNGAEGPMRSPVRTSPIKYVHAVASKLKHRLLERNSTIV